LAPPATPPFAAAALNRLSAEIEIDFDRID
jgi:hypothetical protein